MAHSTRLEERVDVHPPSFLPLNVPWYCSTCTAVLPRKSGSCTIDRRRTGFFPDLYGFFAAFFADVVQLLDAFPLVVG